VAPAGATPDPEVRAKPARRQFSAAYKLEILTAAEQCAPGELGALLRREGLYSSHLAKWRREQEQGVLQGLSPKARGRRANPQAKEIARLQQENTALRTRLQQAEAIIDAQKKLAEVLRPNPPTESNGRHGSAS
jgi:transposase